MNRTLALLAAAACWTSAAPAQVTSMPLDKPPPTPSAAPTTIALRPAAAPVPALKYRLVPERRSQTPGNAAVFYHRAILMATLAKIPLIGSTDDVGPKSYVRLYEWSNQPLAEVPREAAGQLLDLFGKSLKEVELGAQRASCDWGLDRRDEGINLLLPEIQEMRFLGHLVMLRARLATLDGKPDEAMHWLQVGLTLGRHVGDGPTLIQALVGVAIDSLMLKAAEELIQVPGTPSLYWAFADRPRPFIELGAPMEGERAALETELPDLKALDRGIWGLDQARKFADELQRKYALFASSGGTPAGPADLGRQLLVAAAAAKSYPEAKRALIAEGRPAEVVEAMPVIQVAALHAFNRYTRLQDDSFKWVNVPYWQSHGRIDAALSATAEDKRADPIFAMFRLLIPALNSVRLATLRLDRRLDALQCIEAVRLHAAAHGGKLPATLEEIVDAPTPLDIATGKPFTYKLDGDSATLAGPVPPGGPDHPTYAINYLLKLAR